MADRALLIGINSYPHVNQLRGCLNDVKGMTGLLTNTFGFPANGIQTLIDDQATKTQILSKARDWLFHGAQPGDRLVFHFSGHGSQVDDTNDPTGQDEILCLYDIDIDKMDPGTYLTDKELGQLFSTPPQGVQLLAVFDSCHSGTGTRALSADVSRALGFASKVRPLVLQTCPVIEAAVAQQMSKDQAGQAQAISGQSFARYVQPNAHVLNQIQQQRKAVPVYSSFADRVQGALKQRPHAAPPEGKFEMKQLVPAPFDYLFYAACRSDQTAADATIEGDAHGAFTYYFTQVLATLGPKGDRRDMDQQVERDLALYRQTPQFESRLFSGPVFPAPDTPGGGGDQGDDSGKQAQPSDQFDPGTFPVDALRNLGLALGQFVSWAQQGQGGGGRGPGALVRPSRDVTGKVLVTVHGIGVHPAGYSKSWWDALSPYVGQDLQPGDLGGKRQEVLWSDIVNGRGLTQSRDPGRAADVSRQIKETLRDRANRDLDMAAPPRTAVDRDVDPKQRDVDHARDARDLSIPNIGSVDDFVNYLINSSVRQQVLQRFYEVVQPLLQSGNEVELISHSWGTVVAYEGLLNLEQIGGLTGRVHNFFTVGAALSIFAVKPLLIASARTGRRPSMVDRWVNLNARFDVVGGNLQGNPYSVNNEYLGLLPFGCSSWLPNPVCAHSSYFRTGNVPVNRDIFATFIEG